MEIRGNKYVGIIITKELKPPLGDNKFFAKVNIFKIGSTTKSAISHNLGERWGKTKIEAEEKMKKELEIWLKKYDI